MGGLDKRFGLSSGTISTSKRKTRFGSLCLTGGIRPVVFERSKHSLKMICSKKVSPQPTFCIRILNKFFRQVGYLVADYPITVITVRICYFLIVELNSWIKEPIEACVCKANINFYYCTQQTLYSCLSYPVSRYFSCSKPFSLRFFFNL